MRRLGKTNILVNEIGCGGIPFQKNSFEEVFDIFTELLKNKMTFIDTARGYANSEELIGYAIQGRREEFVIATKSMARTYQSMKEDVDTSLRSLGISCIDLYQLHNVRLNEDYSGAVMALKEARNAGKIKHIGITSHSFDFLMSILDEDIFETIQFPYNIIETQGEELFFEANKRDIGVIIMKPLAGGAINNSKLALKFIVNNSNISVAIPGMNSIDQVKDNALVDNNELSNVEIKEIANIRITLGEDFCRRCGYCGPCSVGINIPLTFLCEGYFKRYDLKGWALERYNSMQVKPSECILCGKCEKKCPYNLAIIKKLKNVVRLLEEYNEK